MNEKQKIRKQIAKKNSRKVKFYYSFLTVVLLFCLIEVGRSALLNITKTLNYKVKVKKMMVLREEVQQEHDRLTSDIENFGNLKSLEAIARNNLKLAGENEALVIINKEQQQIEEPEEIQEFPEADEIQENTPKNPSIWEKIQKKLNKKEK